MKQLNDIESAYLSGFLEKTHIGLYIVNTPSDSRPRRIRVCYQISVSEEQTEVLNRIMHVNKKIKIHKDHPVRITNCSTRRSHNLPPHSRSKYIFHHGELRELLPMLQFKTKAREAHRLLAIQILEVLRKLQRYSSLSSINTIKKLNRKRELENELEILVNKYKSVEESN